MRLVRVGAAATSMKVCDFSGNSAVLRQAIDQARASGVHLLVTPELGLSGYSLEDKILWPEVAAQSWRALLELAPYCEGIDVFVGLPIRMDAMMYNAMALIHNGRIGGLILKKYLPTYSIFYEGRNWAAWTDGVTEHQGVPAGELVFRLPYGAVSGEICEDMWSPQAPAHGRVMAGAEIICNASASPFTPLKNNRRRRMAHNAAESLACVYVYANMLGCDNSRLVFDGGGLIATPEGVAAEGPHLAKEPWTLVSAVVDLDAVARARSENSTWRQDAEDTLWEYTRIERVNLTDGVYEPAPLGDFARSMPRNLFLAEPAQPRDEAHQFLDELFDALVLGLRDYYEKVGAFNTYLIALSGGRDSALCLLLAVYAARAMKGGQGDDPAQRVRSAYLAHGAFSTRATEDAARRLAEAMGVPFHVVSIDEEAESALKVASHILAGETEVAPMARQNLQARIRGAVMLNWANSVGGLVLVTSNLSEAAVGYTTTGGDNQGGYSPIANVPKTVVTRLLEHIAERDGLQPLKDVLAIPPSAELAADQQDETDLMPYAVLDDLLYLYGRQRMTLADCWRVLVHRHPDHNAEQLRAWTADFGTLFAQNQWKREQLPVTMKVMDLDLDPKTGFRFPVTQSIEHELATLRDATA